MVDPPRPLSAAGHSAVSDAKARSLAVTPANRAPAAERPELRAALGDASESAFHLGVGIAGVLVIAGGVVSLAGIQNPRRLVAAEECPGGALYGASRDQARAGPPAPAPARA